MNSMKKLHDCFDKKRWLHVQVKVTILKREWEVPRNIV